MRRPIILVRALEVGKGLGDDALDGLRRVEVGREPLKQRGQPTRHIVRCERDECREGKHAAVHARGAYAPRKLSGFKTGSPQLGRPWVPETFDPHRHSGARLH